jgi:hypothetical protein
MNTNMNPAQLMQMLRQQQNPKQVVMNMFKQQVGSNPMGANILAMAENNDGKGIERVVRNMFKERGMDFDSAYNSFKQSLGVDINKNIN